MERKSVLEDSAYFTSIIAEAHAPSGAKFHTVCRKPFSARFPGLGSYRIVVPDHMGVPDGWEKVEFIPEGTVVRDNGRSVFVHDNLGDTTIRGIPCNLRIKTELD